MVKVLQALHCSQTRRALSCGTEYRCPRRLRQARLNRTLNHQESYGAELRPAPDHPLPVYTMRCSLCWENNWRYPDWLSTSPQKRVAQRTSPLFHMLPFINIKAWIVKERLIHNSSCWRHSNTQQNFWRVCTYPFYELASFVTILRFAWNWLRSTPRRMRIPSSAGVTPGPTTILCQDSWSRARHDH